MVVRIAVLALAGALVMPAVASAGGFATVQLASTPGGVGAGETWVAELTVLQHGRTPLDGLSPSVTISNGDERRTFPAVAADRSGAYRAEVVFPAAGEWRWEIWDGFTQTHTYTPIEVAPARGGGGGSGTLDGPLAWLATGLAVAVAATAVAMLVVRRRARLTPA